MRTVSIRVSGRVQGVYFRASTKEKADELGISGWVKNERDGSVYIEAQAAEAALEKFIEWCKRGPSHAKVETFDLREIESKSFSGFEIRRGY
jgi:acylphosphatase